MSDIGKNKQLTQQYVAAIEAGDRDTLLAILDDAVQVHQLGSHMLAGTIDKRGLTDTLHLLKEALPEGMKMTLHTLVGEGDLVAAETESYGRHISGKIYNNKYHFLFRFQNGKIIEIREYCDTEHVTDVLCGGQRPPQG